MDAIKSTIQSLENALKTRKGKSRDVEDAISQLSSTVRLFELSSPSANTFTRLAELLRGRILPLYRISLLLALEYAAAVFRFIYQNKITPALQPNEPRVIWEKLAASLLSGILDFLDETTNSQHRESVASAIFPLLCPIFFCQNTGNAVELDGNLTSVVYQLLMTTAELHTHNAGKLRDQDIGSKHLGFTILQTKELLAMESLLELFAVLIPPVKDGREKRTQFIKEVFAPSIFSSSDRIIRCLESIASPDWSITASEIMNILAESDISFPQPFEASHLAVNEVQMQGISSFYVDKSKFIANLDKDGQIETFHLPFSTIRKLSISPPRNGEVQITVKVAELPMLGDKPIGTVRAGEVSVSWTLKQIRMHKFGRVLKSRNINVEAPASRKLSKTEEIILDFDFNKQDSLALTREKVQSLSQLWASESLPTRTVTTSPLVPSISTPSLTSGCVAVPVSVDDTTHQTEHPATVSLNPGDKFSFEPQESQERINEAASRVNERLDFPKSQRRPDKSTGPVSSDEISQPRPGVNRSNRRIIPASDDDEDVSPSPSKDQIRNTADKIQDLANDHDHLGYPPVKKSKKRPAREIEEDKSSVLHTEEKRPVKRSRLEPLSHSPVAPTRPYQRKKYGKKGPNSSPKLSTAAVDFDELPRTEAPKPVKETSKPRASAMKAKNGKPVPKAKAKRAPVQKTGIENENLNVDRKSKDVNGITYPVKIDPDITLVNLSDNALKSPTKDISVQHRRSARVAKTVASNLKKNEGEKTHIKKPRKAPWEDNNFLEKNKISSDPVAEPSDPIEDPIKPSDPAASTESEMLQAETLFVDNNDCSYTETFSEYFEPTKTGTSSSDHVPLVSSSKTIVIDLTQDEPPKQPRRLVEAPTGRRRSFRESLPRNKEERVDAPIETVSTSSTKKANSNVAFSPKPAIQMTSRPTAEAKVANSSFLSFQDSEEVPTEKPKLGANLPPKSTIQRMTSPLPIADVKVTESSLPPYRENEKVSTSRIERLTLPLPNIQDEQFKRWALSPRPSMSSRTRDKDRPHARSSEIPAGKHTRGPENGGPNFRHQQQRSKKPTPQFEPEEQPMDRIVDILNQINEAIIHKVERRFDGVTEELHTGQRIILEGTAKVLQEMCTTSTQHFNDMVDLDLEYRSRCTKITNGLHDYRKSAEQLSQCFKDIVVDHSRRSLSKKLPATMFPNIPSIISNPTIRL